jgi:hypothetical protein
MDNDKMKNIILKAVAKSKVTSINENKTDVNQPYTERMHPAIEDELKTHNTSLGRHSIFPHDKFSQEIMDGRFKDVVGRVKRNFDMETINDNYLIRNMGGMIQECMKLEAPHKKELILLAEKMIREEFDIDANDVEFVLELTPEITLDGTQKNPVEEMEFDNHKSLEDTNNEVSKRRFLNAMIQGAAKKSTHMFHAKDDELTALEPRLLNKYGKLMSAADYMYYTNPTLDNSKAGGIVRVKFPTKEGERPIIEAKAYVFPVLIHELVKGVMELLSSHGLPKDEKTRQYVIGKADYVEAEPWDMRMGPALWERFTKLIDPKDFGLKHHVYSELAALPVNEFNETMREIMSGTKAGKERVGGIVKEVKTDLQKEDFDKAMDSKRYITDPKELDDIDLSNFGL